MRTCGKGHVDCQLPVHCRKLPWQGAMETALTRVAAIIIREGMKPHMEAATFSIRHNYNDCTIAFQNVYRLVTVTVDPVREYECKCGWLQSAACW